MGEVDDGRSVDRLRIPRDSLADARLCSRCFRHAPVRREAAAFAPATVGNVGVGFDVLGHAHASLGDTVIVQRLDEPVVRMAVGTMPNTPTDAARNTAGAGLLRLIADLELPFGFEVMVRKGIPLGSGMGGSAASAAAAILAANQLLDVPLSTARLLEYGMHGEAVATGAYHADNLAPALLGGLVLVRGSTPPDAVRIPVPEELRCVLVHPSLRIDTREARTLLPATVSLHDHVVQSGNLAALVAACHAEDFELISRSLTDIIVEPHRRRLVPGFREVQRAALAAGALGCSLSGSGPSVFAWCRGAAAGIDIRRSMVSAFEAAGVQARGWISRVDAPGAVLVSAEDGHTTVNTSSEQRGSE
jgi:homoserine kinase